MGSDLVELDPEGLRDRDQLEMVSDLLQVQPLVLQRLERPLPDPVLAG